MTEADIKKRLNFKKIDIEEHAVERAIERLKRKNKDDALCYCRALLGQSRYVGETTCDRGNRTHMFIAPNKVEIYLTLDLTTIKTVILNKEKDYIIYDKPAEEQPVKESYNIIFSQTREIPLQDKLIKLYQTEFKKYDRLEKKMEREFTEYRLNKNIEMAQIHLHIFMTKSQKVKKELEEKVREIENTLSTNLLELKKIQDDKRRIAKVLSSLITS